MDIPLSVYAEGMRRVGIHPVVISRVQQIPGAAWGAVMTRPDRPERKALYDFSGALHASFPTRATDYEIRAFLALGRFDIDGDGTVWAERGHNPKIHIGKLSRALSDAIALEDCRLIDAEIEAMMSTPFSIAAE